MIRLDLATAEYIGARAQQQDHAAAVPLSHGAMLILADGLGGHESGAEASRIVVDAFREASLAGRFDKADQRRQALKDTVERANTRIADGVDPAHGHRGMASTVVAAVVSGVDLSWVSVGDSHLYVWRGGKLTKLNEDHSQAGLMVRSGQYRADDPEVQAVKSVLVSALTGRRLELVDLPQKSFKVEVGDILMLASDGLNTLPDDEVERIIEETHGQGAVRLSTVLLETVRSRRVERQDNTTVAVARVLELPASQARTPPLPQRESVTEAVTREVSVPLIDDGEAKTERVETPIELPAETASPVAGDGEAGREIPTGPVEDRGGLRAAAAPAAAPGGRLAEMAERAGAEVTAADSLLTPRPKAEIAGGVADAGLKAAMAPLPAQKSGPSDVPPRPLPAPRPVAAPLDRPAGRDGPTIKEARLPDVPLDLPASRSRPGLVMRALLVLLLLTAAGVASVAALKPEWLAALRPPSEPTQPGPRPPEPTAVPSIPGNGALPQQKAVAPASQPSAPTAPSPQVLPPLATQPEAAPSSAPKATQPGSTQPAAVEPAPSPAQNPTAPQLLEEPRPAQRPAPSPPSSQPTPGPRT